MGARRGHDVSAVTLLSRRRGVLAEGDGAPVGGDAIAMEDSGVMLLEDDSGNIALED